MGSIMLEGVGGVYRTEEVNELAVDALEVDKVRGEGTPTGTEEGAGQNCGGTSCPPLACALGILIGSGRVDAPNGCCTSDAGGGARF